MRSIDKKNRMTGLLDLVSKPVLSTRAVTSSIHGLFHSPPEVPPHKTGRASRGLKEKANSTAEGLLTLPKDLGKTKLGSKSILSDMSESEMGKASTKRSASPLLCPPRLQSSRHSAAPAVTEENKRAPRGRQSPVHVIENTLRGDARRVEEQIDRLAAGFSRRFSHQVPIRASPENDLLGRQVAAATRVQRWYRRRRIILSRVAMRGETKHSKVPEAEKDVEQGTQTEGRHPLIEILVRDGEKNEGVEQGGR